MHVQSHNCLLNNLEKVWSVYSYSFGNRRIKVSKIRYHKVIQEWFYKFMLYFIITKMFSDIPFLLFFGRQSASTNTRRGN